MAAGADFLRTLKRLSAARKEQRKTQDEIASALHVSRQAVAAWESGIAWPTADKLFAWARLLGFEIALTEVPT